MTATGTTLTSPGAPGAAGRPVAAQVRPVTLGRVIRSEWINLRSLRSTVVVSALTVVIMVALGLLIPYFAWKNAGPIERFMYSREIFGTELNPGRAKSQRSSAFVKFYAERATVGK